MTAACCGYRLCAVPFRNPKSAIRNLFSHVARDAPRRPPSPRRRSPARLHPGRRDSPPRGRRGVSGGGRFAARVPGAPTRATGRAVSRPAARTRRDSVRLMPAPSPCVHAFSSCSPTAERPRVRRRDAYLEKETPSRSRCHRNGYASPSPKDERQRSREAMRALDVRPCSRASTE